MKPVIYIPSLGYSRINDTVRQYASRMMKAIDENAPDAQNTYRIESKEMQYDSDGNTCEVVSLFETNGQGENEIYRFFEFSYNKFLTQRIAERSLLVRAFTIFIILISRSVSVFRSIFNPREEVRLGNKFQALYFTFFYSILAAYLFFLLMSMGLSVAKGFTAFLPSEAAALFPDGFNTFLKSAGAEFISISSLPVFSLFVLLTSGKKNAISDMAVTYIATHQYLSIGEQRNLIMGKLTKLIECVAENSPDNTKMEIHSYSFGSVLALDVLFPVDGAPNTRVAKNTARLVTIGCPFDFIEIYWKGYFSNRKFNNLELADWYNVNADLDVLASKFADRPFKQSRFVHSDVFWQRFPQMDISYNIVNPERISKLQALLFYGVRAHQMYWDQNDVDARSCLDPLVQRMITP